MGNKTSIILSRLDVERIELLLESPAVRDTPTAERLLEEFERAEIVEPEAMPHDVVSMNSSAECVEDASGKTYTLTLVYPKDADADAGRVSVLAPIGSALLGLRVGQSIDWPRPGGKILKLKVTAIHYQPEAAGDLDR
ncbi:MAG: nucleoside diphosphate kinase regulator [Sorangiineae bacterium]|nr:nucleoside diphosphate kinase regulator [Polyangiaceae bacterium]MEB2322087.1 nucleoside diphosphate kinase regulator [Sorangiineae bacterium]